MSESPYPIGTYLCHKKFYENLDCSSNIKYTTLFLSSDIENHELPEAYFRKLILMSAGVSSDASADAAPDAFS